MDVKLALGYLSCIFAAAATYYEWKNGFQKAKPVTLICVVSYFVLNSLAWLYAFFVEKQDVFVGTKNVSRTEDKLAQRHE
jgi:signal peptidase complex subunit 2